MKYSVDMKTNRLGDKMKWFISKIYEIIGLLLKKGRHWYITLERPTHHFC